MTYMRGRVLLVQTCIRNTGLYFLDVDGDIIHHVHSAVKEFAVLFDKKAGKLLNDIHINFKYSPYLCDSRTTFQSKVFLIDGCHY